MLNADLRIRRHKTTTTSNDESFFFKHTETSETLVKLSMGKEHVLVFGAQSRNDIFVVMIHCRGMVNVILLHE